jgi:endonuclease/exonuclease/phosphatase family metal-dependent hydrolase
LRGGTGPAAAGAPAARPVPAGRRVVVASYNTHRCVGVDGRRDPARIAEVIRTLGADVVALQEVDSSPGAPSQLDLLAQVGGLHAIWGPTLSRREGHYGNVLLTRLPVRAVRKLDLTVHRREPRGALDVDLDAGGAVLRVIGTHLGLRPSERRHQVQRILEAVADDHGAVTVLLGDINEWFVAGRPLRWLHARFGRGGHARTYPSWCPLFALDRVWVRPTRALAGFAVHRTGPARRASDHLPVTAEVIVRDPDLP